MTTEEIVIMLLITFIIGLFMGSTNGIGPLTVSSRALGAPSDWDYSRGGDLILSGAGFIPAKKTKNLGRTQWGTTEVVTTRNIVLVEIKRRATPVHHLHGG